MKHELTAVELTGPTALLDAVRLAEGDLVRVGRITASPTYAVTEAGELGVTATLAADA
jgi:hypothetical protein